MHPSMRLLCCVAMLWLTASVAVARVDSSVRTLLRWADDQSSATITRQQVTEVLASVNHTIQRPPGQYWPACSYVKPALNPDYSGSLESRQLPININGLTISLQRHNTRAGQYPCLHITGGRGRTFAWPITWVAIYARSAESAQYTKLRKMCEASLLGTSWCLEHLCDHNSALGEQNTCFSVEHLHVSNFLANIERLTCRDTTPVPCPQTGTIELVYSQWPCPHDPPCERPFVNVAEVDADPTGDVHGIAPPPPPPPPEYHPQWGESPAMSSRWLRAVIDGIPLRRRRAAATDAGDLIRLELAGRTSSGSDGSGSADSTFCAGDSCDSSGSDMESDSNGTGSGGSAGGRDSSVAGEGDDPQSPQRGVRRAAEDSDDVRPTPLQQQQRARESAASRGRTAAARRRLDLSPSASEGTAEGSPQSSEAAAGVAVLQAVATPAAAPGISSDGNPVIGCVSRSNHDSDPGSPEVGPARSRRRRHICTTSQRQGAPADGPDTAAAPLALPPSATAMLTAPAAPLAAAPRPRVPLAQRRGRAVAPPLALPPAAGAATTAPAAPAHRTTRATAAAEEEERRQEALQRLTILRQRILPAKQRGSVGVGAAGTVSARRPLRRVHRASERADAGAGPSVANVAAPRAAVAAAAAASIILLTAAAASSGPGNPADTTGGRTADGQRHNTTNSDTACAGTGKRAAGRDIRADASGANTGAVQVRSCPLGLYNFGNTCYMNSTVQVLCSLRSFVADLGEAAQRYALTADPAGVPRALHRLAHDIAADGSTAQLDGRHPCSELLRGDLRALKDAVGRRAHDFLGSEQQDAHEFFCALTGQLQAAVVGREVAGGDSRSIALSATACPVARTFSFCIEHQVVCSICQQETLRQEHATHLSLELPDGNAHLDAQSLLQEHLQDEVVQKNCEGCGAENADHDVHHVVRRLPRVLALHFKRFKGTVGPGGAPCFHKVHDSIGVPDTLQLGAVADDATQSPLPLGHQPSPHPTSPGNAGDRHGGVGMAGLTAPGAGGQAAAPADAGAGAAQAAASGTAPLEWFEIAEDWAELQGSRGGSREAGYSLRGVISHLGASRLAGHYTADVRDDNGRWYRIDDEWVRRIWPNVDSDLQRTREKTAYMLVYVANSL